MQVNDTEDAIDINDDDSKVNLNVFSTEENEKEEEKDITAMHLGELIR